MIRFLWVFSSLYVCSPAVALQCMPETPMTATAAAPQSVRVSTVLDCRLGGEGGLSLRGELVSTLIGARGSFRINFTSENGRLLGQVHLGPWLGQFTGLALDEILSVPIGSTRIQIFSEVQSTRSDGRGVWQVIAASLNPSIVMKLDTPDGMAVTVGNKARWELQTASGSPATKARIEVRNLEGEVIHQASQDMPAGGGLRTLFWPILPVGYYDVLVMVNADGVRSTPLHSSIAVVPEGKVPPERRFGMDAALSWYGGTPKQVQRSIAMMQLAGVGTVRDRFSWGKVQPTPGDARWGRYAEVAALVASAGLDAVQVFHDSPAWARGGGQGSGDRQPSTDDAAIYALGRAYAQGLGKTVRNIEYWNEQNSNFFLGFPYQYASGLKAFSAGIKSSDPDIRVLIGAASGKPGRFFDEIYRNNIAGFFDVRNQHYYGKKADIVRFVADEVSDLERRGGVAARSGWLTEMGYSLTRDTQGDWRKAELEQAEYIVKTYTAGFAAGYERVFFFFFRELIEAEVYTWGIVREDFSPRPAYVALATLTRHLAGASLDAVNMYTGGMTVYFRQSSGSYSAVTWGEDKTLRFSDTVQAKDIYGRALNLKNGWPTDGKPILLSGIARLPDSARKVATLSTKPFPSVGLRVSAEVSVNGKSIVPTLENRIAVRVADDDTVVLSGRVYNSTVSTDSSPLRVQCSGGGGLRLLSTIPPPAESGGKDGAPYACSFKATLSDVGESYIEVSAEQGNKKDMAHVALEADARQGNNTSRALVNSGACLNWIPRASTNVKMNLITYPARNTHCPVVGVMSRVVSSGETWVFPAASVKGKEWLGAKGVRILIGNIDGVAPHPAPLLLQLVERSGGIWLIDLQSTATERHAMSGLFNLAKAASWARDDNGVLDLNSVREVMLGWGGYAGKIGQEHGFSIKSIELIDKSK